MFRDDCGVISRSQDSNVYVVLNGNLSQMLEQSVIIILRHGIQLLLIVEGDDRDTSAPIITIFKSNDGLLVRHLKSSRLEVVDARNSRLCKELMASNVS